MKISGFVLFTDMTYSSLEYRFDGQALPRGSVPVAMKSASEMVRIIDQEVYPGIVSDDPTRAKPATTFAEQVRLADEEWAAFS